MAASTPSLAPDVLFKAAQGPRGWLESAKRLSAAAELILSDQLQHEVPYFRAHQAATDKALALACATINGAGHADIEYDPPNYLPAQLLYGFALENVFKGLCVAKDPSLIGDLKLKAEIKSHDLKDLADKAGFTLGIEEVPVLDALSQIAIWAGRYPVAVALDKYPDRYPMGDPQSLLDYGAHHPILRRCFARAVETLEKLAGTGPRFGVVVVFAPKTA